MAKAKNTEEYVANAAEFAQPILRHLRSIILDTLPELDEQIKWQYPCFLYKGKILCHFASFKAHCSLGFWLAPIMTDPYDVMERRGENSGMGQFGKITSLQDLPSETILREYILEAAALIDAGKTVPKNPSKKPKYTMPIEFKLALDKNPDAFECFKTLSNSHQNEYLEYVIEAKREKTKLRRIEKSIGLLLGRKNLNAKYSK